MNGNLASAPRQAMILLACLLATQAAETTYAEPVQGAVLTVTEENDLVVRTDRHYTQGMRITFLSKDDEPSGWNDWFASIDAPGMKLEAQKLGFAVGQNIYTPKDVHAEKPDPDDRPYAGWLYLGGIWQRRGASFGECPTLDHVELDLGIIGPESLARQSQTFVHEVRGFFVPRGWDHQLNTEPGVALKLQRQWRLELRRPDSWGMDLIPQLGGSAGNVATFASAGATVRAGYHLPQDFGVQIIDSLASNSAGRLYGADQHFGCYIFAGVEGRAVAYTAFLDGNLFQESPSVRKEPFVGDFRVGGVLCFKYCDLAYTHIWRTKEFVKQHDENGFGSLSLGVKF